MFKNCCQVPRYVGMIQVANVDWGTWTMDLCEGCEVQGEGAS